MTKFNYHHQMKKKRKMKKVEEEKEHPHRPHHQMKASHLQLHLLQTAQILYHLLTLLKQMQRGVHHHTLIAGTLVMANKEVGHPPPTHIKLMEHTKLLLLSQTLQVKLHRMLNSQILVDQVGRLHRHHNKM
jgi:hypothetical protein